MDTQSLYKERVMCPQCNGSIQHVETRGGLDYFKCHDCDIKFSEEAWSKHDDHIRKPVDAVIRGR